jgi:hypothetical protein
MVACWRDYKLEIWVSPSRCGRLVVAAGGSTVTQVTVRDHHVPLPLIPSDPRS